MKKNIGPTEKPAAEIKKERKKTPVKNLDYYLNQLANSKVEEFEKIFKYLSKFDHVEVLSKLSVILESASTIDTLRNAHDVFVKYGEKSIEYINAMLDKPGVKFDAVECALFSLHAIGNKSAAQKKLLELYSRYKNDNDVNLQIVIDMFELDLLKEAVDAAAYHMSLGLEQKNELLSVLVEFFEEHLEIESWLRQQNDANSKNLISIIDDIAESFEDMTITQNSIEFFKFEDFLTESYSEKNIPETIFCYDLANNIANYITHYKQENYLDFLDYSQIKGFVFCLVRDSIELIKNSAEGGRASLLCDLDSDAAALFLKDTAKSQFERLYSFFWDDMKLIYGPEGIQPINIDFFAWKMSCQVYTSLREFISNTGGITPDINSEDENFLKFVFNISEEIVGGVEEFVSCTNEKTIFKIDESTVAYFKQLIKKNKK
ncbi:MAG TPA: hypothetical protein PKK26_16435 [Candidatus Wallbacteria bacterium]|nr:hypothetical protein [Candidatus Wallbacteria bacterium]